MTDIIDHGFFPSFSPWYSEEIFRRTEKVVWHFIQRNKYVAKHNHNNPQYESYCAYYVWLLLVHIDWDVELAVRAIEIILKNRSSDRQGKAVRAEDLLDATALACRQHQHVATEEATEKATEEKIYNDPSLQMMAMLAGELNGTWIPTGGEPKEEESKETDEVEVESKENGRAEEVAEQAEEEEQPEELEGEKENQTADGPLGAEMAQAKEVVADDQPIESTLDTSGPETASDTDSVKSTPRMISSTPPTAIEGEYEDTGLPTSPSTPMPSGPSSLSELAGTKRSYDETIEESDENTQGKWTSYKRPKVEEAEEEEM